MQRPDRPPTWKKRAGELIDRLFPERQFHLRTRGKVSFARFTQRAQILVACALLLAGGWTVFTTITYVRHDAVLSAKNNEIAKSRFAYRNLLGEVTDYQKKFITITSDLENNHALMLGLVEKNATLQQNLTSVSKQLTFTKSERKKVTDAREELKEELVGIEERMRKMASRNFSLTDNLNTIEADLQSALVERNQALFEGTRMRRRIKNLEVRLTDLQETEELAVQRLTNSTATYIGTMEKVVKLAGLDLKRLLKGHNHKPSGQGGPFFAISPDDLPGSQLKANLINLDTQLSRWEALQGAMQRIPLAPPLNSFYITSKFGKRRDPINRRWAAHYGIDMGNGFKSAVYATAPGVVTYAGWKGKYGKLVEIDHGAGLKTRYGHLNRFFVKKGEKVKFHKKIGLLGSTGRSTGAHLHYEVVFRGRAKNPMKFIRAGRYVFQE